MTNLQFSYLSPTDVFGEPEQNEQQQEVYEAFPNAEGRQTEPAMRPDAASMSPMGLMLILLVVLAGAALIVRMRAKKHTAPLAAS